MRAEARGAPDAAAVRTRISAARALRMRGRGRRAPEFCAACEEEEEEEEEEKKSTAIEDSSAPSSSVVHYVGQ